MQRAQLRCALCFAGHRFWSPENVIGAAFPNPVLPSTHHAPLPARRPPDARRRDDVGATVPPHASPAMSVGAISTEFGRQQRTCRRIIPVQISMACAAPTFLCASCVHSPPPPRRRRQ
ncbi:unnamed protein product [Cercospora beticola]|nr:unnamed protein product [Cercospora beticola]